jgi:anti-sigma regulatory factor (Ser/Thr protein kinase)
MRRVLGDILRTLGIDGDSVSDILLAATEACSNVLRHGGPRATGYAVMVTIGAARCDVEIAEDWGGPAARSDGDGRRRVTGPGGRRLPRPSRQLMSGGGGRFERHAEHRPRRAGSPAGGPATGRNETRRRAGGPDTRDITQLPESGRGLDVMRACVDDVTLRSRPGQGTVVIMRKRIDWASDAPLARMRAAS